MTCIRDQNGTSCLVRQSPFREQVCFPLQGTALMTASSFICDVPRSFVMRLGIYLACPIASGFNVSCAVPMVTGSQINILRICALSALPN
mmetsp:Transcript_28155/g.49102  ORF Transcript_28155/g.49102 Transcript_28155/m.49102 type:complete len:90 (+) Transcript_28155:560-829(+)